VCRLRWSCVVRSIRAINQGLYLRHCAGGLEGMAPDSAPRGSRIRPRRRDALREGFRPTAPPKPPHLPPAVPWSRVAVLPMGWDHPNSLPCRRPLPLRLACGGPLRCWGLCVFYRTLAGHKATCPHHAGANQREHTVQSERPTVESLTQGHFGGTASRFGSAETGAITNRTARSRALRRKAGKRARDPGSPVARRWRVCGTDTCSSRRIRH